jgi:hypothetical protein
MKKYLIPALLGTGILTLTITIIALDQPLNPNTRYNNQNNVVYQGTTGMMGGSYGGRGGMMGNSQGGVISTDLTGSDYDETSLKATLDILLMDEFKARAEYEAIVDEFGLVSPYTQLIQAETQHIQSLERIYDAFGFAIPADTGKDYAVLPTSLDASYQIGITAETNNIALYETYLLTDLPTSVERVFANLQRASENHLATFSAYESGDTSNLVNGCIGTQNTRN